MHRPVFSILHPAVLLGYGVTAVVLPMVTRSPIDTLLSLLLGAGCCLFLQGRQQLAALARFLLPLFFVVSLVNPLVNQRGATPLFYLFGRLFTLEAVVYGFFSACSLAAAVLWLRCAACLLDQQKVLFLLSGLLPGLSLMISMIAKLLPVTQYKIRCIQTARKALGGMDQSLPGKIRDGVRTSSILLEWSMEDSIETADSMRARGYGAARRSCYTEYFWRRRDIAAAVLLAVLLAVDVVLLAQGEGQFEFYPRLTPQLLLTPGSVARSIVHLLLLGLPLFMEAEDLLRERLFEKVKRRSPGSEPV